MAELSITIFACHNSTSDFAIILGDKIGRYATKEAAAAIWSKAIACELFGAMQFLPPGEHCGNCHHAAHTDVADFAGEDLNLVIDAEQAAFNARMAAHNAAQAEAGEIDWFGVIGGVTF